MRATEQLPFVRGRAPVSAQRLDGLQDPEYAILFDVSPLHPRGAYREAEHRSMLSAWVPAWSARNVQADPADVVLVNAHDHGGDSVERFLDRESTA